MPLSKFNSESKWLKKFNLSKLMGTSVQLGFKLLNGLNDIGIPSIFRRSFRQIFYKCFLCSFQLWSLSHLWSHSLITPRGASHLKLHPSWILYEMQITPFQIPTESRPLDFRLLSARDESLHPTPFYSHSKKISTCRLETPIMIGNHEIMLQSVRSAHCL